VFFSSAAKTILAVIKAKTQKFLNNMPALFF